jgi:hypothetical protein
MQLSRNSTGKSSWVDALGKSQYLSCFYFTLLCFAQLRLHLGMMNCKTDPNEANPTDTFQIHVSFITKQLQNIVNEKVLRDIFVQFGEVHDVTIKKHTVITVSTSVILALHNFISYLSIIQ